MVPGYASEKGVRYKRVKASKIIMWGNENVSFLRHNINEYCKMQVWPSSLLIKLWYLSLHKQIIFGFALILMKSQTFGGRDPTSIARHSFLTKKLFYQWRTTYIAAQTRNWFILTSLSFCSWLFSWSMWSLPWAKDINNYYPFKSRYQSKMFNSMAIIKTSK